MRLLVRFALAACAVIILLIWLGMSQAVNNERNDPETDETVRILLMSEQQNRQLQPISVPQITFNVAVVLIVSLLSVALLITGIIVVAVTLDPTMADNESDDDELEETKTTSLHGSKFLWHPGISSPSGRLLPQFDTLNRLQSLSDVTVA
uniref:Transmembrane protein n=1 Tax=Ascaris lumbricoides TaxID=6252 RepID=A0A0M3IDR3_ASCLU